MTSAFIVQFIHSGIEMPSLEVLKCLDEKKIKYVHVLKGKQDNKGNEQQVKFKSLLVIAVQVFHLL